MFEYERIQQMHKMGQEKKGDRVEAAAFTFVVAPKDSVIRQYITVHVKPFEVRLDDDGWCDPREPIVEKAYFTPERIEELKRELIRRIEESDNPFCIWCSDSDSYEVDKDKIFRLNNEAKIH